MASPLIIVSSAVVAVVFYVVFQEYLSPAARKRRRLPPGPPGVPFLGNTDFPIANAHIKFKEWADTYGEIYSLRLGSTNIVVLNSDRVIKELMDSVILESPFLILERKYLLFKTVLVRRKRDYS
jgi:hypothetical protein